MTTAENSVEKKENGCYFPEKIMILKVKREMKELFLLLWNFLFRRRADSMLQQHLLIEIAGTQSHNM